MLTHAHVPSRVRPFAVPLAAARQAPLSMGLSRQGYWSGLPFPLQGTFPTQGSRPGSSALYADALPSEPQGKSWMDPNFKGDCGTCLLPYLGLPGAKGIAEMMFRPQSPCDNKKCVFGFCPQFQKQSSQISCHFLSDKGTMSVLF